MLSSFALAFALTLAGASGLPKPERFNLADTPEPLKELAALTGGSFTTLAQSKDDPRYGVVESETVRIWPERTDGIWFYTENAWLGDTADKIDADAKAKPYFQRVIHAALKEDGESVLRVSYRLKAPDAAVNAWLAKEPLHGLSPDDLLPEGCPAHLNRIAKHHWTAASDDCPNNFRGAVRVKSLGIILKDRYANWDRGFDAAGAVVWGPKTGGYIFQRKTQ